MSSTGRNLNYRGHPVKDMCYHSQCEDAYTFQDHEKGYCRKKNNKIKKNLTEMKELREEPVASFPAAWISGPVFQAVMCVLRARST
jgi:hypothetical protein